jgi:hypothetical protein
MEKEGGSKMRYLLIVLLSLSLTGCSNPLTRLLPKLEKLEVDADLMKPPQELKLIDKPTPEQVQKMMAEKEEAANVPPK